ncbi:MAG: hypothetical protein GYB31_20200 [Bacteroidetes bacterium]|nr:hypothetical protein [Bacteroidota bacterium]
MIRCYSFLLLLILITSCKSTRIARLFTDGEISEENFYTEVPFELRAGLIIVTISANDQEFDMIFDTGAPNLFSTPMAEALDLPVVLTSRVSDSQNRSRDLPFTRAEAIQIGDLVFEDFGGLIADWEGVAPLECLEVDGLIGANLMRRAHWQIDYEKRIIRIANDLEKFKLPADTLGIPFTITRQGTPHIDIDVDGQSFNGLTLDLGSNKGMDISESMYRKLLKETQVEEISGHGYGSAGLYGQVMDTVRQITLPTWSIGGHTFPTLISEVSGGGKGALGNEFFQNYTTTLDWENQRAYLSPNENQIPLNVFYSLGLTFRYYEGKLEAAFIYENGAADRNGIEVGQQVLQVDEYDFRAKDQSVYCSLMLNREEFSSRDSIEIVILEGDQPKQIILKRELLLEN